MGYTEENQQGVSKTSPNSILIVMCMATVLIPFMGTAMNLALPFIAKEFSMNAVSLSWVVSIFLVVSAIFPVPFSRLGDEVGRKKIFTIGIIIFIISSILCAISANGTLFLVSRLLQGFGASMMFATNMAILMSVYPPQQRGKALGMITLTVYLSGSSGPFLGGILTHFLGWRSIFYVTAFIGLAVFIGILTMMKGEWTEKKGNKFDWIGSVLYGVGIATLIFGFSKLPSLNGFISVTIGIISMLAFVLYEKDHVLPVLNVRLFWENKIFGLSSTAALINYSATASIAFLLSLYLQYIKGFSASEAGLILIIQPIVQAIISPIAGQLSDKSDARNFATTGMAIIVVGLLLMLFIGFNTPVWFIAIIAVLLGAGFGIFSSPNMSVIMGSVEKQYLGMASATTNTMRLAGQSLSMGITMMVISILVGNVKITPEVHSQFIRSIHVTFIILAALCCIGVYASWSGKKIPKRQAKA